MKHLRIIILVLLSILLPVRGAMAATMLCPDGERMGTAAVAEAVGHDDHSMHAGHTGAHSLDADEAPTTEPSSDCHPATCHFCASACCMASMVGTVPPLAEPVAGSSVTFPTLNARIPAFQSDGQERPPRTL